MLCVQFSIRMLDHPLYGNEYESVIVSFLASSGIDTNKGIFKDVQVCTRDLSALIKMAQLFVIRQGIYNIEKGKSDYLSTSIEEMRTRFMTFDGRTPMGWIHGLRAYGRKLSESRTVDGDVVWSSDYQTIVYKDFECSLANFRTFISTLLEKARGQLADLFLVQNGQTLEKVAPAVRLFAIKDIPKESRAGWSFLQDERNEHLVDGSTWMVD